MYAYNAECWRTCPYTINAFSVNGYVSLTGFTSFTPLPTRHIIQSTIETTALKTTYRSIITARRDIDCFIIQLSTLMAAEKSSETNWHRRRVTCDDDNYHDYRIRPCEHQKSNTISTSQLSAIISQRSYHGRNVSLARTTIIMITGFDPFDERNRIPFLQVNWARSSVGEPTINDGILPLNRQFEGQVNRPLRVSIVATTFLQFERSASTSIVVYTYNSSNLVEARRTAKTTKAIRRVSEWRR